MNGGGRRVAVASLGRSSIATINPYSNEVVREFPPMEQTAVDQAVDAANDAFASWRATPVEQRAALVGNAAQLMRERSEELAHLITLEMGKLIGHSRAEIDLAARILEYYAEHGPELLADEPLAGDGGTAVVVNAPLGVVLGVQPWNFPFYQAVRFAGPNLVLGNTILLKHASNTPQCAIAMEQLFADAGLPPAVYTNLLVPGSEIARIIDNPLIRGVSLTGSNRAGASVGENAGRKLKKSVLELGGSDPFVVLDADHLERTVEAVVTGRMHNMGQTCVSPKRIIVLPEAYDELVARVAARLGSYRPGDPAHEATTLAPLSSEEAAERLMEQVRDALEKGATAVVGGRRVDHPGAFVEPTVLIGVTPAMRAYHEELFGPVFVIYQVADDAEAVTTANDSRFGLGAAVFAGVVERARAVADQLEAGMVWINHPTSSEPHLPFGGIKDSGYGRELSHLGIKEFSNQKLVVTMRTDAPVRDALG
jgi:succinate-semialdehyde dehydrogenase/glutarate-semialdehyde dehydrogenase